MVNAFQQVRPEGVCNGFTTLWALAETASDAEADKFHERLNYINEKYVVNDDLDIAALMRDYNIAAEKKSKNEPLSPEDIKLLEVKEFCHDVAKYQDFFNLRYNLQALQNNTEELSIENVGATVKKDDYKNYLESMRQFLQEHQASSKGKICFLHGVGAHTMGLSYSPETQLWKLMDINIGGKKHVNATSERLAEFILKHYKKGRLFANDVQFSMEVFARGCSKESIEKMKKIGQHHENHNEQQSKRPQAVCFSAEAAQLSNPLFLGKQAPHHEAKPPSEESDSVEKSPGISRKSSNH
ncbi:MAG: hypothetical protein JSR17_09990 [Proteobacteria bacterium]|nr:hypothetical protein [Pseudomonadota bacterium]